MSSVFTVASQALTSRTFDEAAPAPLDVRVREWVDWTHRTKAKRWQLLMLKNKLSPVYANVYKGGRQSGIR